MFAEGRCPGRRIRTAVTAGWGAEKARVGEDIVIRRRVRMRLILLAAMVL